MIVKELETKYENIEFYEITEGFNLLSAPQILKIKDVKDRYGERKVLYQEDHDDEKITEILVDLQKL